MNKYPSFPFFISCEQCSPQWESADNRNKSRLEIASRFLPFPIYLSAGKFTHIHQENEVNNKRASFPPSQEEHPKMWWKIWFHHPRKVLSLHCTQKPNITKKILLPTRKQTKVAVGKWKNGIFQCMVMSMSLFIYLFIYSHQHLSTILSFFFVSPSCEHILYTVMYRCNLFRKRNGESVLRRFYSFNPQEKTFFPLPPRVHILSYFCSIPSVYQRTYICRWANDRLFIVGYFLFSPCPILGGAFWNEIK